MMRLAVRWLVIIGYGTSVIALLFIYTGIYSRLHSGGHDVWEMFYVGLVGLLIGVGLILRKRWGAVMAATIFAGVAVFILKDSVVYIFTTLHNNPTSVALFITVGMLIATVSATLAISAFIWLVKKAWLELT